MLDLPDAVARPLRFTYPGAIHHAMARSNDQRHLFVDDEDRYEFMERMRIVREMFDVEWRMHVLMNTHFHAKVKTPHGNISAAIGYLLSHYAQWWNRRHNRHGHLLEARFKAPLIEDGWYSRNVIRYIALNPVKAKYVEHASEWRWGSHRALAGLDEPPEFLDTQWLTSVFDGRTFQQCQREYANHVDGTEDDPIELVDAVLESSPEFAAEARTVVGATMHQANVPRRYRALGRPTLELLFSGCDRVTEERNRMIVRAQVVHGYTQSEIARALDLHPNTVSKVTVAVRRRCRSLMHAS